MHNKSGAPVAFVEFTDIRLATHAMNALQGFILFSSSDRGGGIRIEYAKNKMGDISGGSSSGGSSSVGGSSINSQPLNHHHNHNHQHQHQNNHISQHHLQLHHHNNDIVNSIGHD
ncbi:RNA-binding protein with multiple splicing 2 [Dermatophagoides pteronyssinus]|uniref:RNA-binding protein with multiple splicing 2 n=1 Tax=Dermatophagoides pteronyssinus TaxID=6956 RepID=A0ABQ8IYU5_DERPT|nr:RNA-binding protein with multiple splicing 2 [Dermatophagoides pteronyssinus]